ncbi:MAG: hypothetical protein EOM12_15525 [Verrucomicrobiae bacterium]|nr:hypothetical protein [Verrucomicrobiae bacterium]
MVLKISNIVAWVLIGIILLYIYFFISNMYQILFPSEAKIEFQRELETKGKLSDVLSFIDNYKSKNGEYPVLASNFIQQLKNSGVKVRGMSPSERQGKDDWGNEIKCTIDNSTVTVFSAGSDGVFGTKDDLIERKRISGNKKRE